MQAEVLGVVVGADSDAWLPPADLAAQQAHHRVFWDKQVNKVLDAFTRLAHLSTLSIFGRGLGSAAYGIATMLFNAEFSDLPPDDMTSLLTSKVAKLVDRALAPASHEHVFPGIEQHLLIGSPAEGGFGCFLGNSISWLGMHGGVPNLCLHLLTLRFRGSPLDVLC